MDFDISYGGALLAGLVSFASPCVLPVVPAYLCFLAGVSLEELTEGGDAPRAANWRIILTALAFTLGFATIFVLLGASASSIGQALSRHFDTLRWIAGGLIMVLGLHFLGVLRIPILFRHAQVEVDRRPANFLGAYVVGLAFGFGWTPCVGPVLAAILFVAASKDSAGEGAALLGIYALGMGAPFVAAAAFARPFMALMRGFRRHLGKIEKAMGLGLVATGLLFVTNTIPDVANWMIEYVPAMG